MCKSLVWGIIRNQNPKASSKELASGSSNTLAGGGDLSGDLTFVGETGRSATTRLLRRRSSDRGSGISSFSFFVGGSCFKNSQFRTKINR